MKIIKALMPYLSGLIILAAWYSLIIVGKTPTQPFIEILGPILGGGGVHVIHLAKDRANAKKMDSADKTTSTP